MRPGQMYTMVDFLHSCILYWYTSSLISNGSHDRAVRPYTTVQHYPGSTLRSSKDYQSRLISTVV